MDIDAERAAGIEAIPPVADPGDPSRRRSSSAVLSSHIPVRFSPALAAAVRALADQDGITVSTWIRTVVAREVQRRTPPQTRVQSGGLEVTWDRAPAVTSETFATRPVGRDA